MTKKLVLLACLAAAACAQTPESIAPAYVSYLQYNDLNCSQLSQELARLDFALAQASKQQYQARTGDTLGILFLGLPTASMSGENIAPQIATYKGEEEAMHEAVIRKNCASAAVAQAPEGQAPAASAPAAPQAQVD
jgi:hypothetical protein